jgi:hypothetical protein
MGPMQNHYVAYKLDENHKYSLDKTSAPGMTALHFSVLNGSVGLTEFLCLHHANTNAQSEMSDTPLHFSIRRSILGSEYDGYWTTGDYAIEEHRNFISDWDSEEASEIFERTDTTRGKL